MLVDIASRVGVGRRVCLDARDGLIQRDFRGENAVVGLGLEFTRFIVAEGHPLTLDRSY